VVVGVTCLRDVQLPRGYRGYTLSVYSSRRDRDSIERVWRVAREEKVEVSLRLGCSQTQVSAESAFTSRAAQPSGTSA
jgi:hypothetical protein